MWEILTMNICCNTIYFQNIKIWGHIGLPTGFLSIILLLSRLHDARSGCYMFTLTPIFVFSHQSVLSHPSLSAHTHPCILTPITVLSQPPIPILYISTHLWGSALEIFNFYLLSYYLVDQDETLQSDTRHWCTEWLNPWFCIFFLGGAVGACCLNFSNMRFP